MEGSHNWIMVVVFAFIAVSGYGAILNGSKTPISAAVVATFALVNGVAVLWVNRKHWTYRVTQSGVVIGTTLVVVGMGVLVMWLPLALRYAFQPSADLSFGEAVIGALGGMMVAGGWFLRQSARR